MLLDFGKSHRLAHVLTLDELGLAEFPMTVTGKVKKRLLLERVISYVESRREAPASSKSSLGAVMEMWRKVLAIGEDQLTATTPVTAFADSIITMQFCYEIEKVLHQKITPDIVANNTTPEAQAAVLDGQPKAEVVSERAQTALFDNPWGNQSFLAEHTDMSSTLESIIRQRLGQLGLTWQRDVETIYEPPEGMSLFLSSNARPSNNNIRSAFVVKKDGVRAVDIRQALIRCLERHAAMRALVIPLDERSYPFRCVHAVLRCSERWLANTIQVMEPVKQVKEVLTYIRDPKVPFAGFECPSFRASIMWIRDVNAFGLCISACHAAFDSVSQKAFMDDVATCLAGTKLPPPVHTPYQAFADMYRIHKTSALGIACKQYHKEKIDWQAVSVDCSWPRLKGSECSTSPKSSNGRPEERSGEANEQVSSDEVAGLPGGRSIHVLQPVPGINEMRLERGIDPSTVLKTAVALFNLQQSGQKSAFFKMTDAGRKWPFIEEWVARGLPNPLGIDGPCLSWSLDCLSVSDDESIGHLLHRLQDQQRQDSAHPHAPWLTIREELDHVAREKFDKLAMRQTFNWDPNVKSRIAASEKPNLVLQPLGRSACLDVAVLWNFGLIVPESISAFLLYDDAHLTFNEAKDALESVYSVARWIVKGGNWDKTAISAI